MSIHTKKHRILKVLLDKYLHGEENSGLGRTVTDLGRSMTNIQIHNKTSIPVVEIDNLCQSLNKHGYVTEHEHDDQGKAHRYLITDAGRAAVTDKALLSGLFYRDLKFLIPVVISLLALTIAWMTYSAGQSKTQEIEQFRKSLQKVQRQYNELKKNLSK